MLLCVCVCLVGVWERVLGKWKMNGGIYVE